MVLWEGYHCAFWLIPIFCFTISCTGWKLLVRFDTAYSRCSILWFSFWLLSCDWLGSAAYLKLLLVAWRSFCLRSCATSVSVWRLFLALSLLGDWLHMGSIVGNSWCYGFLVLGLCIAMVGGIYSWVGALCIFSVVAGLSSWKRVRKWGINIQKYWRY